VVIVGGGLSAGMVARQLTAKGIEVLVLENGGDVRNSAAAKLPTQRDELRWATHTGLMQDGAAETYTWRHNRTDPSLAMRRLAVFLPGSGVGGAGNHWNGQAFRWEEYDTELRTRMETRYGKSSIPANMPIRDWGVSYSELEPYYDLFERLFGISGKAGNLRGKIMPGGNPFEAPRQNEFPQRPLEETEIGLIFRSAADKFGYKSFLSPAANSPDAYTNPDGMKLGACQYCGHCDRFICEAEAKATPSVLLYPLLARRPSFELRKFCHVIRIEHDAAGGQVRAVEYLDLLTGETFRQPADVVVLAAFTLSNTKLLLTSGIGRPYDAAANAGVVGRNFCYQTNAAISVYLPDRWLNPFLASGSTVTLIEDFDDDNFDHTGLGFLGGGFIAAGSGGGRPIAARGVPPGTPRWGTRWKQANADWYAHAGSVGFQGSSYPHRENFLDLDPDYRDAYGQPLLRVTFDMRENELRMAKYCAGKMVEIARAMGAARLGGLPEVTANFDTRGYQSTHITGGTIMGRDPATSVVSSRLQHWDAENLFVVGASVFAHNSGHNPTELVATLALRLGDDLVRYVGRPGRLA